MKIRNLCRVGLCSSSIKDSKDFSSQIKNEKSILTEEQKRNEFFEWAKATGEDFGEVSVDGDTVIVIGFENSLPVMEMTFKNLGKEIQVNILLGGKKYSKTSSDKIKLSAFIEDTLESYLALSSGKVLGVDSAWWGATKDKDGRLFLESYPLNAKGLAELINSNYEANIETYTPDNLSPSVKKDLGLKGSWRDFTSFAEDLDYMNDSQKAILAKAEEIYGHTITSVVNQGSVELFYADTNSGTGDNYLGYYSGHDLAFFDPSGEFYEML